MVLENVISNKKCNGKLDGNYPLHGDAFKYLICKKGENSTGNCSKGNIFYPDTRKCGSITRTTLTSFCQGRSDGDWQNPWNCYGYILCQGGYALSRPCLINGFIFNPEDDVCQKVFPCKTVYAQSLTVPKQVDARPEIFPKMPQIKDICTTLRDDYYSTRDTLQMLRCVNRTAKFVDCPKDTIYINGSKCTDSSKVNEGE